MVYAWVMQRCALVVALAGCGFHGAEVSDARVIDTPVDMIVDQRDPDMTASTFCDPMTGLVACYEFEGTANDATANRLDATVTNVMFPPTGQVGSAMLIAANSSATVAASTKFDVAQLTIEAWIQPSTLPAPTKIAVVLDVDNQYALWITDTGAVTCDLKGSTRLSTTVTVPILAWSHVACTYDATAIARIYVNGSVAVTRNGTHDLVMTGPAMAIGGNSPSGSPLVGLIDQVRLLSVARSGPQICSDAGQSSCL